MKKEKEGSILEEAREEAPKRKVRLVACLRGGEDVHEKCIGFQEGRYSFTRIHSGNRIIYLYVLRNKQPQIDTIAIFAKYAKTILIFKQICV